MANRSTDRRALGWLAAAHVVNDMNQGAVPALLPFLIAERGLTYAAAGGVVLAATLLSSLIQPVLGHLSDRRPLPFLMPLAVLAAGGGIALAGLVTSYGATIAAVLLSGAGVAAFHPESARYANYASGERRATGMSVFSVGGNLGIAFGPVAISLLAGSGGVARIVWMALPAGLMAALLARELPRLRVLRPEAARSREHREAVPPQWGAFTRLSFVIAVRSLFAFGLVSFVPLYLVKIRGIPKERAALAVTAMLLAGAVATLAGGRLADRFGRRAVLAGALLPLAPLLVFFLHAPGIDRPRDPRPHRRVHGRDVQRGGRDGPGVPAGARGHRRRCHDGARHRRRRGGRSSPRRPRRSPGRGVGLPRPGGIASPRRGALAHASRTAARAQTGSPERRVR